MAIKPCARCKKMIPAGQPYCMDCRPIVEAERQAKQERKAEHRRRAYNRAYNARRDPERLRFYRSKDWRVTSRAKLQAVAYKCEAGLEGCTGLAVEVHHIKPIQTPEGWELRLEWDNLEAVCIQCHNRRHDRFRRKAEPGVLDLRQVLKELEE